MIFSCWVYIWFESYGFTLLKPGIHFEEIDILQQPYLIFEIVGIGNIIICIDKYGIDILHLVDQAHAVFRS